MGSRLVVGLCAGMLLLGTCYVEGIFGGDDKLPPEYTQGPEALSWLRQNEGESALASNRFGETQNAARFVKQLYEAGALQVIIPLAVIQTDQVESYADAVVVSLPSDPSKRNRVWKICAEELKRIGETPDDNPVEDRVLLRWD